MVLLDGFGTRAALAARDFVGGHGIAELRLTPSILPREAGVYSIVQPPGFVAHFLEQGSGGLFKGQDSNVPIARLKENWVAESEVVYFGKAGPGAHGTRGLRKRLNELFDFGAGQPVGHRGERFIWQLTVSAQLQVWWRIAPTDYDALKTEALAAFKATYGRLPFANLETKGV